MEMADYKDKLKELRYKKGLTLEELANKLDLKKDTLAKKLQSDNTSKVIDILLELGITLIDEDGNDIITGEPHLIKIDKVFITKEQFDNLKNI